MTVAERIEAISAVAERINAATKPLPDHIALIECRRENVRVHREMRAQRETVALLADELTITLEEMLACVRRIVR